MNWYILSKTMNEKLKGNVLVQARGLFTAEAPYRDDIAKFLYEPIPEDIKVPNFKLEHRER